MNRQHSEIAIEKLNRIKRELRTAMVHAEATDAFICCADVIRTLEDSLTAVDASLSDQTTNHLETFKSQPELAI